VTLQSEEQLSSSIYVGEKGLYQQHLDYLQKTVIVVLKKKSILN